MTNIEIDRRLAEATGIVVHDVGDGRHVWYDNGEEELIWEPSVDMGQAWMVAERFGLGSLSNGAQGWIADFTDGIYGKSESPQMAICIGTLKKIKNREKI